MPRAFVILFALVATLIGAPSAFAQAPRPSVSTSLGTVTPSYTSGSERPRTGDGPSIIKDGFGLNPPTLGAEPGSLVTITLQQPADAVVVYLGPAELPVTQAGGGVYTVVVPAEAALPQRLGFRVESSTPTTLLSDGWTLNLGGDLPADPGPTPPPTASPTPAPVLVPAVPPVAKASGLRVSGRRLSVAVTCPAAASAPCAGTLTLKTSSLRIARLSFTGLVPGTTATLRATITVPAQRHLRRHRYARLRTLLLPGAGQPVTSTLPLRTT